jgi:hypothetical protein
VPARSRLPPVLTRSPTSPRCAPTVFGPLSRAPLGVFLLTNQLSRSIFPLSRELRTLVLPVPEIFVPLDFLSSAPLGISFSVFSARVLRFFVLDPWPPVLIAVLCARVSLGRA